MRGDHHQSNREMMGTEHATPSHFQLISPATPSQQRHWETGQRSTASSHSLSTARLQKSTATYPDTHSDPATTPDLVSQVPCDSSCFAPFTPGIRLLRTPPISHETSESSVETDSSSTLSGDSPFLPTFLAQHYEANQDSWYRSTFHLRPSQDSESHASDSSYYISGHSSTSSHIEVINLADRAEAVDAMEGINANNLSDGPRKGATSSVNLTQDTLSAADQMQIDDRCNPTTVDGAATQGNGNLRGRGTALACGRGRGASSARGRGRILPPGLGCTLRAAKRPRARRDADDPNHEDNDNDRAPKTTKKRKSNAPDPPVVHPVEIHRRKTSLRERLISGEFEPQAVGMRVYNMKKAAAAAATTQTLTNSRNAPREFLIPTDPRLSASAHDQLPNSANNTANTDDAADIQSNPRIAYKSTPLHQLHFPEGLVLALKQNMIKWEGKKHSEGLVFVVVHLINSDVADMHVFSTLRDATADALWIIINEHPEVFALPRNVDADGVEIKFERYERATSLVRDINGRPNFVQVPMPAAAPTGQGYGSEHAGGSQHNNSTTEIGSVAGFEREDSLFVIKEESPGMPRPSRFADPRPDLNDRGELLLGDAPEPAYVFSGKFRIVSLGLKMEARRADGAVVKVSVHLKNLRRPAPN
ncbi:hypothetical protein F4782DRAFT_549775 [Xylaria castorea]|nr:hypothetical protein F4782DRAFT_549775 [Xylaria castorea]